MRYYQKFTIMKEKYTMLQQSNDINLISDINNKVLTMCNFYRFRII
jgi:hypothetical protein